MICATTAGRRGGMSTRGTFRMALGNQAGNGNRAGNDETSDLLGAGLAPQTVPAQGSSDFENKLDHGLDASSQFRTGASGTSAAKIEAATARVAARLGSSQSSGSVVSPELQAVISKLVTEEVAAQCRHSPVQETPGSVLATEPAGLKAFHLKSTCKQYNDIYTAVHQKVNQHGSELMEVIVDGRWLTLMRVPRGPETIQQRCQQNDPKSQEGRLIATKDEKLMALSAS